MLVVVQVTHVGSLIPRLQLGPHGNLGMRIHNIAGKESLEEPCEMTCFGLLCQSPDAHYHRLSSNQPVGLKHVSSVISVQEVVKVEARPRPRSQALS